MRLSRWMLLIGVLVGLGCLRVTQHHAVVLKSYAVGERVARLHEQHNDVAWLNARIAQLASPAHLGDIVQERRMNLVAWATLGQQEHDRAGQKDLVLADGTADE